MSDESNTSGLGYSTKDEWPRRMPEGTPPIDYLRPDSDQHKLVLDYLVAKLEHSERRMSDLYERFRAAERSYQAYINVDDYEKLVKNSNDAGNVPDITHINIPYTASLAQTRITYFLQAFFGRRPFFPLQATNSDSVEQARNMTLALQYQCDRTRLLKHYRQWFLDGEIYGFGALKNLWEVKRNIRTIRRRIGGELISLREDRIQYESNVVEAIDPFLFFPDPRVPLSEVADRGEFVFWRSYEGRHMLKRMEQAGEVKYVDATDPQLPWNYTEDDTDRNIRFGERLGDEQGDYQTTLPHNQYQIDQGTIDIIPAELGLGPEEFPVRYLFMLLNKNQIVQAEPLNYDHGKHPVSVIEPATLGYGFGHGGTVSYMADLQYAISWMYNSHMFNVRSALNNTFVVNPQMVEMKDFEDTGPGRIIRLKQMAYGRKIDDVVQQLSTVDVTRSHIGDIREMFNYGERLTSVSDALQGIQSEAGRKTATEIRTSTQAGASRLAADARLISAQGVGPHVEQMCSNTQQFMSQEFYIQLTGQRGQQQGFTIAPEHVVGDFYYPVSDGTLPVDNAGLFQIWQQLFPVLLQSPLGQQYNMNEIFEEIAELGGIQDMHRFRLQQQPPDMAMGVPNAVPDAQAQQQIQQGNGVPVDLGAILGGGLQQ